MKDCSICKVQPGKYKCPICLIYYCSVACCKTHREDQCQVMVPDGTPPKEPPHPEEPFTTQDTVPKSKLLALRDDPQLKEILANPHLREVLKHVDSSTKPDEAVQRAMLEPLFVEFADACLRVVEPPDGNC